MSDLPPLEIPLLILAGGKATRLGKLSADRPKYLMPVGQDRVFADVHLDWVRAQGFRKVILSVGWMAEMIREYCQSGERWGLEIVYAEDGPTPVGTGGAVAQSLQHHYSDLAVTYGDTLLNLNARELFATFCAAKTQGMDCLMTVFENTVPGHVCNATIVNDRLTYDKFAPDPKWKYIDYGFLFLSRSTIESEFALPRPFDLALPLSKVSHQGRVFGVPINDRFWEIGSPEALDEFRSKMG